jgi:hypothetical protein
MVCDKETSIQRRTSLKYGLKFHKGKKCIEVSVMK